MASENVNETRPEETNDLKTGAPAADPSAARAEREASFTRRGLLQWTVPVIAAVALPQQTFSGSVHHDHHGDGHHDHHNDTAPHGHSKHQE
jgi:hypothetical protein